MRRAGADPGQRPAPLAHASMETVVCNCCGSDSLAPVYSMPDALFPSDERFHVEECRQCGLGFVNPRPAPFEMQRFYPADYYAVVTCVARRE